MSFIFIAFYQQLSQTWSWLDVPNSCQSTSTVDTCVCSGGYAVKLHLEYSTTPTVGGWKGGGEAGWLTASQQYYHPVTWRLSGSSGNNFKIRRIQLGSFMMKFCFRSNLPPASCNEHTQHAKKLWLIACTPPQETWKFRTRLLYNGKRGFLRSPSPKEG